MSKFYVGQRVRLVHPHDARFKGDTGRIKALFADRPTCLYPVNCDVDWDTPTPPSILPTTHTSRLEPLQPERNQTIAWSECVWKPEHMRAEA